MDSDPILGTLSDVTSKWTQQRKAEERSPSHRSRRQTMWARQAQMSLRDIVFESMDAVWWKASGGGRLPTFWRQMFYVARKIVDAHPESNRTLRDRYFKNLLEDYLEEYTRDWDILYGARGVLKEPHTDLVIPLSTADVRDYRRHRVPDGTIEHISIGYPTYGPENCYGAVLICEKEGFDELLQAENIERKYDLALMSTKGIAARAARHLAESFHARGVRCFTLHDFDKGGFVMASGFPFATDLGLRLVDVEELELEGEGQWHKNKTKTYENLLQNGASQEEARFIRDGRRVELNELPGDMFIEFVERKLAEHGVKKVAPAADTLADAWDRATRARKINLLIDEASDGQREPPPTDLADRVLHRVNAVPELSWSQALLEVMDENFGEGER